MMDEFMAQRVIFSEGIWVTRREVIKYVANVQDGAHAGGGKAALDHVKGPLEYARRRARIKAASGGFNVNTYAKSWASKGSEPERRM